jgi:hypothetical protein
VHRGEWLATWIAIVHAHEPLWRVLEDGLSLESLTCCWIGPHDPKDLRCDGRTEDVTSLGISPGDLDRIRERFSKVAPPIESGPTPLSWRRSSHCRCKATYVATRSSKAVPASKGIARSAVGETGEQQERGHDHAGEGDEVRGLLEHSCLL